MKRVKFGVSGHFQENTWKEWPDFLYADVSLPPSELIWSWLWSVDYFSNFGAIWGSWAFWSCSVDFLHYGSLLTLTETGHIGGFWASGERGWRTGQGGWVGWGGGIFPMLCVEFCLVFNMNWYCCIFATSDSSSPQRIIGSLNNRYSVIPLLHCNLSKHTKIYT